MSSGLHDGSAIVSGLQSMSAARIAVTGRHWLYRNLASHDAMKASAPAMLSRANARAFSDSVLPCAIETWRAAGFQFCGAVAIQKRARLVCACVRLTLVADPISLISSKSRV